MFAKAKVPAPPSPKKAFDPSDYPREGTASTFCCFFLFLLVIPICMVTMYHAFPTTVLSLVFIWICFALAPWAFHAGGAVASDISGPLLTVMMFMSVCLAFLNGVRCYYYHAQPLRQLMISREYQGVYPELPASVFPDAAYLEFTGNAHIDVSKGVALQSLDSGLSTFCAAPIVADGSTGRLDFWAIGVDCCGENGDKFDCHDAGDPTVKTGWVLPNKLEDYLFTQIGSYVVPSDQRRDLFSRALIKAEATHGIVTPGENAIFLRWTKDKKKDILFWETIHVVTTIVTTAIWQIIVSLMMTRLYQRFCYVRKVNRQQAFGKLHGGVANSEEEDMTARLQQFMSEALETARDSDMGGTIGRVKSGLSKEALERFRPPLSASDMCIMGVLVPYVVLMLCVIFSTFVPCMRLGHLILAPFWCMTFILILALLATPSRTTTGLFMMICCVAGYYVGQTNYKENMFHYCSVGDRREYSDVAADASTDIYWDAGKLNFGLDVELSTQHSVGFLYQGTAYCAAPVISKNAPCKEHAAVAHGDIVASNASLLQINHGFHHLKKKNHTQDNAEAERWGLVSHISPSFMQKNTRHHARRTHRSHSSPPLTPACLKPAPKQVEFWATGLDCCDARGRFWCDGGEVKTARQAVVVRAYSVAEQDLEIGRMNMGKMEVSTRQHFFQAINQAVATYELPFPDRPVLLHWGSDSDQLRSEWRKRAIGVILMTGLTSLLLILGIGIASFCFMKRQRRLEKRMTEDYAARVGGQGGEPSGYDSPRPSLGPADSVNNLRAQGGRSEADLKQSEDEMRF